MSDCSLCGLPADGAAVTAPDVDGTFCCRGCLSVSRALDDVDGLDADDVVERGAAATGAEAQEGTERDSVARSGDKAGSDDARTAYLHVDGMHCSTCEAFLEAVGRRADGVRGVQASYATDTVRVRYDPDRRDREELPGLLSVAGYEASERGTGGGDADTDAAVRFLIGGGLFGMMTMLWYAVFLYPTYFGYEPFVDFGGFDGLYLFAHIWVFASVVLFYTGFPILRGAYVSLRARQPNTDLLVALAATGSYLYSTLAMFLGRTDLYFDVVVAVVLVVTAGGRYEAMIKRRATGVLSDLTDTRPTTARLADGAVIPLDDLTPADRLLVRPGERIPLDGTVVDGTAAVDEALVTGESVPGTRRPGDAVRGGTVVVDEPIVVAPDEPIASTLDRIVELLWDVQSARSGIQRLADRLATVFVPLVAVAAVVVGAGRLLAGAPPTAAALAALTVLIVACPCALGLATPLAVAAGVRDAAERGIVITTESIFEQAAAVDTVVFDKTGTLTDGGMELLDVAVADASETTVLARAAAVERAATHPVAAAVVAAAEEANGVPDPSPRPDGGPVAGPGGIDPTEVRVLRRGVSAERGDLTVGHPDLFDETWTVPAALDERAAVARERGTLPVMVGWDGCVQGVLVVGDRPRDGWASVLADISESVGRVVVLTGDDAAAADRFQQHDAVDEVYAGVPPEAKAETVRRLSARGPTAMVGDGSNDAPALAAADVGVALAGGTDLAVDAADAVVMTDRLAAVPAVFGLTRGTNRRIRLNLGWAFCYNLFAIPLAVTGLLNPLLAALAMAASSLLVVLNSARPVQPG